MASDDEPGGVSSTLAYSPAQTLPTAPTKTSAYQGSPGFGGDDASYCTAVNELAPGTIIQVRHSATYEYARCPTCQVSVA
jgi:hypothetical protein